jgi:hypothetical protein
LESKGGWSRSILILYMIGWGRVGMEPLPIANICYRFGMRRLFKIQQTRQITSLSPPFILHIGTNTQTFVLPHGHHCRLPPARCRSPLGRALPSHLVLTCRGWPPPRHQGEPCPFLLPLTIMLVELLYLVVMDDTFNKEPAQVK